MKTALLTGLAAFALGATCATAPDRHRQRRIRPATPVASRGAADDPCTEPPRPARPASSSAS